MERHSFQSPKRTTWVCQKSQNIGSDLSISETPPDNRGSKSTPSNSSGMVPPPALRIVAVRSSVVTISSIIVPGIILPFQYANMGTRIPPSNRLPFSPRMGTLFDPFQTPPLAPGIPPGSPGSSLPILLGAPLSLAKRIMVLSSRPCSRSLAITPPIASSMDLISARPILLRSSLQSSYCG